jgi:hypothetical protein
MGFTLSYRIERHSINGLDPTELHTTTPASTDYGNARHIAMASPRPPAPGLAGDRFSLTRAVTRRPSEFIPSENHARQYPWHLRKIYQGKQEN